MESQIHENSHAFKSIDAQGIVSGGFVLRQAGPGDINDLLNIEEKCWFELQLGKNQLLTRFVNFPEGQYVACCENKVVGVIYSQRIKSREELLSNDMNFNMQHSLHDKINSVLQLLGVAVLPEYAHLQIGDALKQHMIHFAASDPSISEVVAMTRCASRSASIEEYLEKIKRGEDPILQFHLKAGAKVIQAVKNYRQADVVNFGHAVLISYGDFHKRLIRPPSVPTMESATEKNDLRIAELPELTQVAELKSISIQQLTEMITSITNKSVPSTSVPFMSLGLDSLGMVELIDRLQTLIDNNFNEMMDSMQRNGPFDTTNNNNNNNNNNSNMSNTSNNYHGSPPADHVANTMDNYSSYKISTTILFNYPTPNLMLKFLNRSILNRHTEFHRILRGDVTPPSTPSREVSRSNLAEAGNNISGGVNPLLRQATENSTSLNNINVTKSKAAKDASQADKSNMFAIVGMSCRFPTGNQEQEQQQENNSVAASEWHTPQGFYDSLCGGLDSVSTVPSEWDCITRYASFLSEDVAETFDYTQYNLTKAETLAMDPHQRLLLELAHEALCESKVNFKQNSSVEVEGKDADVEESDNNIIDDYEHNIDSNDDESTSSSAASANDGLNRIGVFVGLCNNEWSRSQVGGNGSEADVTPYTSTGTALSAAANRISYLLGLNGPSMVVDTACSSSLVALHTALNSIRCGDCDVAVVAAADLLISSHSLKIREVAGMLSPDGCNRTFDAGANGYVRGEGGGAVVIRRLVDAERDAEQGIGGEILGVIRGSAVNQDGHSASFTAPNGLAQRNLLKTALKNARVQPAELCYIETHGTGTALGDPIEWGAIRESFLQSRKSNKTTSTDEIKTPLVIGAVKTNIGHLEGAAGMAGLIKTIMCLKHGSVPGNLHLEKLNPQISLHDSDRDRAVFFPKETTRLASACKDKNILIAGVSSFGSGGTNAHVIVQNYVSAAVNFATPASQPVQVAAASEPSASGSRDIAGFAFVCAGQGSVYPNMGRELFDTEPVFKAKIIECSNALPSLVPSLVEVLYPTVNSTEIEALLLNPVYSQLALVAVELALAALWVEQTATVGGGGEGARLRPSALTGHSLGEYVVAVLAGILSTQDMMKIVYMRIQCITKHTVSGVGVMVPLKCSEQDALEAIQQFSVLEPTSVVTLAAVNGLNSVVISGEKAAIQTLLTTSEILKNKTSRYLPMEYAYHSKMLTSAADAFANEFQRMLRDKEVCFFSPTEGIAPVIVSCYTGKTVSPSEMSKVEYWVAQMLNTVQYSACVQELVTVHKQSLFVELGSTNVLSQCSLQCVHETQRIQCISSLLKNAPADTHFHASVSFVRRYFNALKQNKGGRFAPNYNHNCRMKWRVLSEYKPLAVVTNTTSRNSTDSTPSELNENILASIVQEAVMSVLPANAQRDLSGAVNKYTPLLSLGVDSLGALAIRNILMTKLAPHLQRLNNEQNSTNSTSGNNTPNTQSVSANSSVQSSIITTLVLKYPTINSIVSYLLSSVFHISNTVTITTTKPHTHVPRGRLLSDRSTVGGRERLFSDVGIQFDFPTTNMQQAMLYHTMLDSSLNSFIETFTWTVNSSNSGVSRSINNSSNDKLNISAFYSAWIDTIRTHDSLRSSFDLTAIPVPRQRIWSAASIQALSLPLQESEWFSVVTVHSEDAFANPTGVLNEEKHKQRNREIDLTVPSQFYVTVVEINDPKSVQVKQFVLFTAHHVIIDGVSMQVILKTLAHYYSLHIDRLANGDASALSDDVELLSAPSYKLFAHFEANTLQQITLHDDVQNPSAVTSYFTELLLDWEQPNTFIHVPTEININTADDEVIRCVQKMSQSGLQESLMALAKENSVTLASLFQAIWCLTYTCFVHPSTIEAVATGNGGCDSSAVTSSSDGWFDLLYGNTTSGRNASSEIIHNINDIVGPVINTLPVRYTYNTNDITVGTLVKNIHEQIVTSLEYENYPLSEIQKLSKNRSKLFNLIFDFQTTKWDVALGTDLSLCDSMLMDRIGCALSVRVLMDTNNNVIELHATSECKEYDHAFLSKLLTTYQLIMQKVVSFSQNNGGIGLDNIVVKTAISEFMNNDVTTVNYEPSNRQSLLHNPVLPVVVGITNDLVSFDSTLTGEQLCVLNKLSATQAQSVEFVLSVIFALSAYPYTNNHHNTFTVQVADSGDCLIVPVPRDSFNELCRMISESTVRQGSQKTSFNADLVISTESSTPSVDISNAMILFKLDLSEKKFAFEFRGGTLPNEVQSGIFDTFVRLLDTFSATDSEDWNQPIEKYLKEPLPVQSLTPDTPTIDQSLMHEGFLRQLESEQPAVVCYTDSGDKVELSYVELSNITLLVTEPLLETVLSHKAQQPTGSSTVIAVVMEKGWEQVAAVLAIHRLHCVYLPMDARLWPEHRIRQVLQLSEAVAVLTQSNLLTDEATKWMTTLDIPVVKVDEFLSLRSGGSNVTDFGLLEQQLKRIPAAKSDDLAYLIYTSGSTGIPKGVCCHHQGAVNTNNDLNELFNVTSTDRVLALSSLSFDLSVYDIFGLLAVGGTVVIPQPSSVSPPDPSEWYELLSVDQISIWNTVPAFMELLVSHAEFSGTKLPACLRLIYMSGDWIPVTLPARIRAVSENPDIRIISMGGATEASIWSNMFELHKSTECTDLTSPLSNGIPAAWNSIPYGRPMRNQRMYILDNHMRNCDVWVTGAIYIGGVGVAHGYYKNPERTAYQFVTHPITGEALFRTGDLGRVRPEGLIEILGREDSQVKVNGFRIELGEIERVLTKHESVVSAALNVHNNTICAYLVLKTIPSESTTTEDSNCDIKTHQHAIFDDLRATCKTQLADYMVPSYFMAIDEIPLSSNGKVMRDKLPLPVIANDACDSNGVNNEPLTEREAIFLSVWSTVLNIPTSSLNKSTNFFSIGGDSLRSLQVVAQAKKHNLHITVPQIFNNPTIQSIALVATSNRQTGPEILGTSSEGVGTDGQPLIFTIDESGDDVDEYPLIGEYCASTLCIDFAGRYFKIYCVDYRRALFLFSLLSLQSPSISLKPSTTGLLLTSISFNTGINQAHFVGLHTSSYAQNGMTPQIYFEWEIGTPSVSAANSTTVASPSMVTGQVDIELLQTCVDLFIERHLTFRSIVTSSGRMKILKTVPPFVVEHIHMFNGDLKESQDKATEYRNHMMDNGPTVDVWPLFEIRVTHTSATSSLIHITVSLFLMDAMSDLILRQELSALYRGLLQQKLNGKTSFVIGDILPPASRVAFSDYCIALDTKLTSSDEHKRAKEYWLSRLDSLSGSIELPLVANTGRGASADGQQSPALLTGRFVNYHRWLTAFEWRRGKKNCSKHLVTMPAVLLAAYSITLYKFGNCDSFLINILQCLRHQVHEDINKMVGNCSSTILCDINFKTAPNEKLTFKMAVLRIAQELSRNLEHASMSGVEVMQELNRKHGKTFKAVAPFIFTTPIGVEKGNKQVVTRDWIFQEKFFSERVPHTACVNAIKADPNGTACASLDIIHGVFPPEVMSGMYETYSKILDIICANDSEAWNQPIEKYLKEPLPVQSLTPDTPTIDQSLMHEGFVKNVSDHAQDAAVVAYSSDGVKNVFSYERLNRISLLAAEKLVDTVVKHKESRLPSTDSSSTVIAVVMEKGWEQVAAVLAIHRLHCVYLPMDARLWPEHRIRQVLQLSEAVAVLTQSNLASLEWMSSLDIPVLNVDEFASPSDHTAVYSYIEQRLDSSIPKSTSTDLAYLIYTSGSTGIPKGVCCHHQGAVNTINDLNELFSVTDKDRVLALSSLSFDLSVYDIFGLLSAGGAVVIPQPSSVNPPDPSEWFDLLKADQISIWNTVPAFMELSVSHAEFSGTKLPACLRLIYMSGDWIPVTLPARIRAVSENPDIRIISMGGATEASIWSNMFELIKDDTATDPQIAQGIPSGWNSIPYGRPMRNQRMYVLNPRMENCEVWVTGAIYIGGVGVAHGYYKNPERTAYQFVTHPVTGEALFRTGDLGRVRPEGLIEILGREDSQVKVNGFRIELGEIERVIVQHSAVVSAALAVHNNLLCAYLVLRAPEGIDTTASEDYNYEAIEAFNTSVFDDLRATCKMQLADYMVPSYFMAIDEIPLSSNGKVMRDKLPSPLKQRANSGDCSMLNKHGKRELVQPKNEVETKVRDVFGKILNIDISVICCEHTTFFELGGNSLSSIQLLFALREAFKYTVTVQELFQNPTVTGVSGLLTAQMNKDSDNINTSDNESNNGVASVTGPVSRLQMLQLNKGLAGYTPIILVNPAGASGLCYIELINKLDANHPVYALDDGVMTSDAPFTFNTIEEVAAECIPHVLTIVKSLHPASTDNKNNSSDSEKEIELVLAGWSYGGVIAVELAKLIQEQQHQQQSSETMETSADGNKARISVKDIFLFDSPLRAVEGKYTNNNNNSSNNSSTTSAYQQAKADNKSSDILATDASLEGRIEAHFNACTTLLTKYHARPPESQPLHCTIHDIRPEESNYHCDVSVIQELTTQTVLQISVPGTHWTMLFGVFVSAVANIVNNVISGRQN